MKRHNTKLQNFARGQDVRFNIALKGNHFSWYITRCHIRITDAPRISGIRLAKSRAEPLNLMKTLLIPGVIAVFLSLSMVSMSAQTQSTASSGATYIETSKFIGQKVKSSQGDEIGTVKDIVLDRSTGCLAYTVVSTSGGGGGARASGGGKMVAVPWAVYSPSSDLNVLTVTVDRERIYNAPVFDYARIEEYSRPEYMTNVYSYYGVSGGGAVGVGVSGSTTTGTTTTRSDYDYRRCEEHVCKRGRQREPGGECACGDASARRKDHTRSKGNTRSNTARDASRQDAPHRVTQHSRSRP